MILIIHLTLKTKLEAVVKFVALRYLLASAAGVRKKAAAARLN